jgi:hypothetical protein
MGRGFLPAVCGLMVGGLGERTDSGDGAAVVKDALSFGVRKRFGARKKSAGPRFRGSEAGVCELVRVLLLMHASSADASLGVVGFA